MLSLPLDATPRRPQRPTTLFAPDGAHMEALRPHPLSHAPACRTRPCL